MELQITQRALARIREVAAQEGVDLGQTWLRIAVVPGGCSGLTYELGWDTAPQADDLRSTFDGIQVIIDRRSYLYLQGTTLDFTDGLEGRGFHFINPQAVRTCACGESFGL
ncbi:HesB/IscA family protein [Rhodothermus bifroesti]|jgi:iron-sulfur cluster assembly protein|uniref:Iron-sulfur cluster assembly accessory protein n=1 Tax=Rhodothermus marinus TaxID=29549 RepID=A0A7V2B2U7_RHOMR|nr:iron-sulfur cluster assembly accessory protein [Rhodothermus bifroesti]GBD02264.1 Iron-sulfur cluster insertion protein ErpA [bacterium HR18]